MTSFVRVLIADDDPLFIEALEAILGIESEIEVAGRANDGEEATRLAGELEPDVVLMDLSMPVLDGFEASRRIRAEAPTTTVVVLTGSSYAEDVKKAYDAGASGYVTKHRIAQDLVRTVLDAVN
ncbi:MAG TPA: response regulator transcription factor [Gaiellaceae bacterium]|nr:response regulator transcription factor [Gaiellaceae bacterium]